MILVIFKIKISFNLYICPERIIMISNSSKYALKAVLYLAVHSSEEKKILAKDLSRPINVPQAYLSKLMQELSRHNLISSTRGRKGGFYLTDENRTTGLMDIIIVIDGHSRLTSCMLSLKKCNEKHPCPLHDLVGETKTRFIKNLEKTSIEDLATDILKGKSFLPL